MSLYPEPEGDGESTAFSRFGVNLNMTAHHFHEIFYNGKAQSCAVNTAECGIFFTFNGFENMFQEILMDTDTVIAEVNW